MTDRNETLPPILGGPVTTRDGIYSQAGKYIRPTKTLVIDDPASSARMRRELDAARAADTRLKNQACDLL